MSRQHTFVATCSRGLEPVLRDELKGLGVVQVAPLPGAVRFRATLREALRVLVWTRIASRVLAVITRFPCVDPDDLYRGVRAVDWTVHMHPEDTLAVDFVGGSDEIRHSRFGAYKTKDAIVDMLRSATGRRPSVDLDDPALRINVHLGRGAATVSVDMAGMSLHERGAGRRAGKAPLKETLAAALLHLAGWPAQVAAGGPLRLVDPLCGSGTLLLEGLGMALDRAPGLHRDQWGFDGWQVVDEALFDDVLREARQRREAARDRDVAAHGRDVLHAAIRGATDNAAALGLAAHLHTEVGPLEGARPPAGPPGLVVANPPYGERLDDAEGARATMRLLGDVLRHEFLGWKAAVLAGSKKLGGAIGLRPDQRIPVHNGPLDCRLLLLSISDQPVEGDGPGWRKR